MSLIANSSEEYWDIDGVSLHQWGWSVATVGGSRYDLPTRRGDNIPIAYRPGALHRNKLAEPRVINLVMWLTGATPSTGDAVADPTLRWNDSWDTLRRLVWKPGGGRVTLTRRWYLTVGGVKTLVVASADAEIVETMAPSMTGRTRADFVMSFLLADPYFYDTTVQTVTVQRGTTVTVNNPGHDIVAHNHLEIDLVGALGSAVTLTNTTPTPDVVLSHTALLGSGTTVTLDVGRFTATRNDGANRLAYIAHSGTRYWMALMPGDNSVSLASPSGAGHAVLRFRAPYI